MSKRTPTNKYSRERLELAIAYSSSVSSSQNETLQATLQAEVDTKADEVIEITSGEGLKGGGDLSANRELSLDVDSLTVDASPDGAVDYVPTWDASAAGHKKVLLSTLLESGASVLNDLDDVTITSPAHNDVLTFVDQVFNLVLSGDMNAGSDQLLSSGDMQSGTDVMLLSGDDAADSSIWKNVPFSSLPLA